MSKNATLLNVETKHLHHPQRVAERMNEGIVIEIEMQHYYELEHKILNFGEIIQVLESEGFMKKLCND